MTTPEKTWLDIGTEIVDDGIRKMMYEVLPHIMAGSDADLISHVSLGISKASEGALTITQTFHIIESKLPENLPPGARGLAALKQKILAVSDWGEKLVLLNDYTKTHLPELLPQILATPEVAVNATIRDRMIKMSGIAPKLAVTAAFMTPAKFITDYHEATECAAALAKNHTLSAEAAEAYPLVAAQIQLIHDQSMHVEENLGYPLFKNWAEKYQVPFAVQLELDPTPVSRQMQTAFEFSA